MPKYISSKCYYKLFLLFSFWTLTGNDKLYQLTTQEPQQLRIDLGDFTNQTRYAKYSSFGVADSTDRHRTSVGGYSGTAGRHFIGVHRLFIHGWDRACELINLIHFINLLLSYN